VTAGRFSLLRVVVLVVWSAALATTPSSDVSSARKKLQRIEENGRSARPDQTPTILTEREVNAYLASGDLVYPDGVKSVKLQGGPGVITGTARVDFDQLREGIRSSNPLLSIFSGIHDVTVVAHARGAARQGYVQVDSVSLDGVEVPRFLLNLFVEKYLQPKYPELGLDSRFSLPDRIDSAVVGPHQLTIIQK
jgi:hypothetical protein